MNQKVNMFKMKSSLFLGINTCTAVFLLVQTFRLVVYLSGNKSGVLQASFVNEGNAFSNMFQDFLLLLLFVISHSVFATSGFKYIVSLFGIGSLDRTIYNFTTSLCVKTLVDNWIVVTSGVPFFWNLSHCEVFVTFTQLVHVIGWLLTFAGVFVLDFPDFIGTKQIWNISDPPGCTRAEKSASARQFLDNMRHPLCSGFLSVLWCVPCMTADRFLLASGMTLYLMYGSKLNHQDYCYLKKMRSRKQSTLHSLSAMD